MRVAASIAVLLISTVGVKACEFFGGAMPSSCPKEATKEWWEGSWATREVDRNGEKLTALTTLLPDSKYKTTLAFDNGRHLEHWGHYKIHVNSDLSKSFFEGNVPDESEEATRIDMGVHASVEKGVLKFGGALPVGTPPAPPRKQTCLKGSIEYFVESSKPDLHYTSPQTYQFVTQGDGFVRVSGPGADSVVARRYN